MSVITYSRTFPIIRKLDLDTDSSIITLVGQNLVNASFGGLNLISVNSYLKNLKAFARIESLIDVPLPEFTLEDTENERVYKILDMEWGSPRKQLDLLIGDGTRWEQIASVSMINPSGYPYRTYNLLDLYTDNLALELGGIGQIGIRLKDVGHGLLQMNDQITVYGSYMQEITVSDVSQIPASTSGVISTSITNQSTLVIGVNPNRKYLLLTNSGENECWLSFGENNALGYGANLKPGGSYDFSTKDNPWYGSIYAICEQETTISGIETS